MPKSKFFCVFVEGDTTDGRVIEAQWIRDIAATYNTATYRARVWLEHFRSLLPDSPFRAYGDVLAVKAEEIDVPGIGKKLALFAQIDPTGDLVEMNKQRQKLFTSAEVQPNFANTGKAYLMGLAVTDSPASLGTEQLAFAAGAKANPLAHRKQDPDNLFTSAHEVELEMEEEEKLDTPSIGQQLFSKVKDILTRKGKTDAENFTGISEAVEAVAESQAAALEEITTIKASHAQLTADYAALKDQTEQTTQAFADLKAQLESEPDNATGAPRKPATGGKGELQTDC